MSDTHSIPATGGDLSHDERAELEDLRAQVQALHGRTRHRRTGWRSPQATPETAEHVAAG